MKMIIFSNLILAACVDMVFELEKHPYNLGISTEMSFFFFFLGGGW